MHQLSSAPALWICRRHRPVASCDRAGAPARPPRRQPPPDERREKTTRRETATIPLALFCFYTLTPISAPCASPHRPRKRSVRRCAARRGDLHNLGDSVTVRFRRSGDCSSPRPPCRDLQSRLCDFYIDILLRQSERAPSGFAYFLP